MQNRKNARPYARQQDVQRVDEPRNSIRRSLLRAIAVTVLAPAVAVPVAGCSGDVPVASGTDASDRTGTDNTGPGQPDVTSSAPPTGGESAGRRVLLASFSRAGENYSYGGRTNLQVGNTEVAAQMITSLIACDVHRIEAADPYPDSYDATVTRNVTEQDEDARPALAQDLPDVSGYDVVLLGSPIWNVRPPMIMSTFTEGLDLAGKQVLPFVTFAVSGLGSAQRVYAQTCQGAEVGEGLAVRGEEVAEAGPDIEAWLRSSGLLSA